jgi:hypothetical protein
MAEVTPPSLILNSGNIYNYRIHNTMVLDWKNSMKETFCKVKAGFEESHQG